MRWIRRLYRIPLVLLWTLIIGVYVLPSRIGSGLKKVQRTAYCTRLWCAGLRRILNVRMKILNPELAPKKKDGGLVIANHMSYLDVFVHGSLVNLRFAPKADIRNWFFVGFVVSLSRPIWINRENKKSAVKSLEEYKETIENGLSLVVYPEGTTTDGNELLPFKSTPFEAAIEVEALMRPMIMKYRQPTGEMTACWYGDMDFLPHVWAILGQKEIIAEVEWLPPRHATHDMHRKELALALHEEMNDKLQRRIHDAPSPMENPK